MVNNIVYFPALYAGYLFYETLTRDIRDDSDIKNTLSLSRPPTNFNSWGERRVRRSVIGATSSDSHEP